MRYEISEQAALDIEDIFVYTLVNFGTPQADDYLKDLRNTFERLSDFPEIGQDISYVMPAHRRLVHKSHAVYYKIVEQHILIVRLLNTKQDPARNLIP
ncbi:MAG: type II toxin-antitoxin system RelE/ParE family toxin [Gammaproteobacteria bacterium]|nr:type II toxin-antitoxin system RelE/ParE family toxin [Gammaproteobacteria bacterium]